MGTRDFEIIENRYGGDHPHACGDKRCFSDGRHYSIGSSPRVWGQDRHRTQRNAKRRIIPTRVGTRGFRVFKGYSTRDHPHACGDKSRVLDCVHCCLGSSPRVWGQDLIGLSDFLRRWIIPTRVGTRLY